MTTCLRAAALVALSLLPAPARALPPSFDGFCIAMMSTRLGEVLDPIDCLLEGPAEAPERAEPGAPPPELPRRERAEDYAGLTCQQLQRVGAGQRRSLRAIERQQALADLALAGLQASVARPNELGALGARRAETAAACDMARMAVADAARAAATACPGSPRSERLACLADRIGSVDPGLVEAQTKQCGEARRAGLAYEAEAGRVRALTEALAAQEAEVATLRARALAARESLDEIEAQLADRQATGDC